MNTDIKTLIRQKEEIVDMIAMKTIDMLRNCKTDSHFKGISRGNRGEIYIEFDNGRFTMNSDGKAYYRFGLQRQWYSILLPNKVYNVLRELTGDAKPVKETIRFAGKVYEL